jgi:hypothetical protein
MGNPLEEFLEDYGVEKKAFSWGETGGTFGDALLKGVAAAGTSALIGGGVMAVGAIHGAATKNRDFRSMMEYNADLTDKHKQDPKMFNQMYTSLRNANPAFAKDPLIAGTYMRKMLDYPTTAGGFLAEVSGAVPSGHGGFSEDVSRAGREAATSHVRDAIDLPFGKKPEEQVSRMKSERQLERMKADPAWVPGDKNHP